MKKIYLLFCVSLFLNSAIYAHSGKPKHHVIIDTDGAIDDMRALSMLLAANDIRVLAITCSQGTLEPKSGFRKVNSMLATYFHNGISIGMSDEIDQPLPAWNGFAEQIDWGTSKSSNAPENSLQLLNRTVANYQHKITLLALGSLKTYADWIKTNPGIAQKIEQIIWYNDSQLKNGFNFLLDTSAYSYIAKTAIPLKIVYNSRKDLVCNEEYLTWIKNNPSIYAQQIYRVHQHPMVQEKIKQNHLQLWDDMVPLYLTAPILFLSDKKGHISSCHLDKAIPKNVIYDVVSKVLKSGTEVNNRVFVSFPTDTTLYKKEYAHILKSTLEKYGENEWKAVTMTNEIHGHTGIYSIIGAKMGIRALEYFNVGVNNLKITSFAGFAPPLSCLNDGIQISTGATIGQGLIVIADSVNPIPTIYIEFNNRKIKISLKPTIAGQMKKDIAQGIENFGMGDEYWIYIEKLALDYWVDFDRHEIFDMVEI